MADIFTDFVANTDVMALMIALIFNAGALAMIAFKKRKMPVRFFALSVFFTIGLFVNQSLLSTIYIFAYCAFASVLMTVLYRKTFLSESSADKENIMMSYIVFFAILLFTQSLVGSEILRGALDLKPPVISTGLTFIDKFLIFAYNSFATLYALFSFSTTLGILNSVLLIPFVIFLITYLITKSRGGG